MGKYVPIAQTVDAWKITGVSLLLDDGSSQPLPQNDDSLTGSFLEVTPGAAPVIYSAADFNSKYIPAPASEGGQAEIPLSSVQPAGLSAG